MRRFGQLWEVNPQVSVLSRSKVHDREPSRVLIEAVESEGFGGGGVVAAAFGDVQVAGVFDGRDPISPEHAGALASSGDTLA